MLQRTPDVCWCGDPDCDDCEYTQALADKMSEEIDRVFEGESEWISLDELLDDYILTNDEAAVITDKIIKLSLQGKDTSKEVKKLKDHLRTNIGNYAFDEFKEWLEG